MTKLRVGSQYNKAMASEKPVWEYSSFAAANKKLRTIGEGGEAKRRFEAYLGRAAKELWILAYRLRVEEIGRPELAASFREWRARNLERYTELQKESYKRHYKKNYPRYLANTRNRRARKNLADGTHTSVCAYCERSLRDSHHVDHMVPLSRGGRNDWTNLAVTCATCNHSKGTLTTEEFFDSRLG